MGERAKTRAERAKLAETHAQKRELFLAALREVPNVGAAAGAAGLPRCMFYEWRHQIPEFADAWDKALEVGSHVLVDVAVERATKGHKRAVYQNGKLAGYVDEPSDPLLIRLLGAFHPDRFHRPDRVEMTGQGGGAIQTQDIGLVELAKQLSFILASAAAQNAKTIEHAPAPAPALPAPGDSQHG